MLSNRRLLAPDGTTVASATCRQHCDVAAGWWRGAGTYVFVASDRGVTVHVELDLHGDEHDVIIEFLTQDHVAAWARVARTESVVRARFLPPVQVLDPWIVEVDNPTDVALTVVGQPLVHWELEPTQAGLTVAEREARTFNTMGWCGTGRRMVEIPARATTRLQLALPSRAVPPARTAACYARTRDIAVSGCRLTTSSRSRSRSWPTRARGAGSGSPRRRRDDELRRSKAAVPRRAGPRWREGASPRRPGSDVPGDDTAPNPNSASILAMPLRSALIIVAFVAAATACSSSGAPPGSACAVDADCANGVCRQSGSTGDLTCYERCPSELNGRLCTDGTVCLGYCRGDGGPRGLGEACSFGSDCLPTLDCGADRTCRQLCDESRPGCPAGTVCDLHGQNAGLCEAAP